MNSFFRTNLANKKPPIITVPVLQRMMCLNESCLDPFQAINKAFLKRMEDVHINRYLSPISTDLKHKLADYIGNGIQPENVIWGNGVDDILYHIFQSVRENEESFALSLAPSYFDYSTFCEAVGLGIRYIDLKEDFSFDTDEYLSLASSPDCKLAILCNPNNPTGNLFEKQQLRHIISMLPDKLVLVDETYYEFSDCTFVDELSQHPNLILTRSFSKAFSSAGLRFGYAISSKENIYNLSKVFTTFHTSILTQAFALTILENVPLFCEHVMGIIEQREAMYLRLKSLPGITVYPSHTNFLTFTIGDNTDALFAGLKEHGIALRDVGAHYRLRNCLRATLSCPEDNEAMYQVISQFVQT